MSAGTSPPLLSVDQVAHTPTIVSDQVVPETNVLFTGELSSRHNVGLLPVADKYRLVSY
jgi:hypothetical protein